MSRKMLLALVVALTCLLPCESHARRARPEVFMWGAARKQCLDALADTLIAAGWHAAAANEYQVTFELEWKGSSAVWGNLGYGGSTPPVYRLVAAASERDSGATLGAEIYEVGRPGTNREFVTDLGGKKKWAAWVADILRVTQSRVVRSTRP